MTLKEVGWPTILSLVVALACSLVALLDDLPRGGEDFLPLSGLGLALVAFAIWRTKRWWLLALVPFIVAPSAIILLIFAACLTGNCL